MKHKLLFSVLCIWLACANIPAIHSQNLILKLYDGSERSLALNSIRKITFSGTDMVLNFNAGTTEPVSSATVQKMLFGATTGLTDLTAGNTSLTVYPNPAAGFIGLKNLPAGAIMVAVCRLDGSVVFTSQLPADARQIDVSMLPGGFYLLKVNNRAVKFVKL